MINIDRNYTGGIIVLYVDFTITCVEKVFVDRYKEKIKRINLFMSK